MAAPDQRQPRAHNQKRRIWLFTHPASGTPLQRTLHEALLATAAGAGSLPGWGHWGTETPFTISHQSSLFGIDFGSKMRIPDRLYLLGGHTPKQSLHPNTAQDPCSSATAPNIQKHWTTMAGLCKPANLYSSASSPKRRAGSFPPFWQPHRHQVSNPTWKDHSMAPSGFWQRPSWLCSRYSFKHAHSF